MVEILCSGCGCDTIRLEDPNAPGKLIVIELCERCRASQLFEADQE